MLRDPHAKAKGFSLTQGGSGVIYEVMPTFELLGRGLIVNSMTKLV